MVEQARFLLGEDENPAGTVGESLERGPSLARGPPKKSSLAPPGNCPLRLEVRCSAAYLRTTVGAERTHPFVRTMGSVQTKTGAHPPPLGYSRLDAFEPLVRPGASSSHRVNPDPSTMDARSIYGAQSTAGPATVCCSSCRCATLVV